jgi:hypothetical protein
MISKTLLMVAAGATLALTGCKNAVDVRQEMVYDVQVGAYERAIPKVNDLYDSVQAGELAASGDKEPAQADDIATKNELLWRMERGAIDTMRADTAGARKHLDRASNLVVERRTASLTREIGTYLANDNAQEYAGQGYEHILVDYHRVIAALVSAQRLQGIMPAAGEEPWDIDTAVQAMNNFARGMTMEKIQFNKDNAPDLRYFDDPYARTIAACIALATPPKLRADDDMNFAWTMLRGACKGYAKQHTVLGGAEGMRYEVPKIPMFVLRLTSMVGNMHDKEGLDQLMQELGMAGEASAFSTPALGKDTGAVLVLNHADWITPTDRLEIQFTAGVWAGPTVTEAERLRGVTTNPIYCGWSTAWAKGPGANRATGWTAVLAAFGEGARLFGQLAPGTWIGFEIPTHREDTPIPPPGLAVFGTNEQPMIVAADYDAYARATLKDLQPGVLTKTLTRTFTKHIAAEVVAAGLREGAKDQGAGAQVGAWLIGLGAHAAASASEAADTRHWGLLPNRVEASLAIVPAGKLRVAIRQADGSKELGDITVPAGRLVIVPTRTFPNPVPSPYPAGSPETSGPVAPMAPAAKTDPAASPAPTVSPEPGLSPDNAVSKDPSATK